METFKNLRLEKEKAELAKLEESMQKGDETPTQSSDTTNEGSPPEVVEEIAGQDMINKPNIKDLEYYKKEAQEYKQRWSVSKAKYDTNIRRMKDENESLRSSKIELMKALNQARQSLKEKQGNKLDEVFDKQTVDVLGEVTADAIKSSIQETNDRLDKQEDARKVQDIADQEAWLVADKKAAYATFTKDLRDLVPNMDAMNADPEFVQWLNSPDERGRIRMETLRNRESIRDAEGCAEYFNNYTKLTTVAPPVKEPVVDTIASRTGPDNLSSETIAKKEEKISVAQIDKFFLEVQKGKWKGRNDERLKIEAKIDQAYLSGNII